MSSCPAGCKRSQHQHGDRSFFVAHRCGCLPCRAANARYEADRQRQKAYGRWQPYVDAGPAREHVRALMAAGMGWKRVAAKAGVSASVVCHLLYGKRDKPVARVRAATAAALLEVAPDLAAGQRVDSTGSVRRLRALVAVGWSVRALATRIGWSNANLCSVVNGRWPQVTIRNARLFADLYTELAYTPPPYGTAQQQAGAMRSMRRAEAAGWAPPWAWDEDTIDDPAASPVEWKRVDRKGRPIEDVVEDCQWLADAGETLSGAAARLGYESAGVLERVLLRAGHGALVRRLRNAA